jgi:acetyl esterase/lipase
MNDRRDDPTASDPMAGVDPQMRDPLRRFLDVVGVQGFFTVADLQERRARYESVLQIGARRGPSAETVPRRDIAIARSDGRETLSVRLYRPAGISGTLPALVYLHGGGRIMGSIAADDAYAAALASHVPCAVLSVDYALAPEHRAELAVEDCYDALTWLALNAGDLAIDANRIALFGNSAGGGLAAGLSLLARRRGGPSIVHQMLIYPMLDDRNITASSLSAPNLGTWTRDANIEAWSLALGQRAGGDDVPDFVAPARVRDFAHLPPTYVEVGDLDIFADECCAFAQGLANAGVAVEFHCLPGVFHGFDQVAPDADVTILAVKTRVEALRRALGIV